MRTQNVPVLLVLLLSLVSLSPLSTASAAAATESPAHPSDSTEESSMVVQYLEIVTPHVEATVALLEKNHGVRFSAADDGLGGARTADLAGGGRLGVRGPLRPTEESVVRPYLLVDDVDAAVEAAAEAGAEIAMTGTEIPGHGKFAIYVLGGIQHGLWER
jgi:predicted enzyme related to lactoylglutathione lyase